MLIFFLIQGFDKNVMNKHDEEDPKMFAALQDAVRLNPPPHWTNIRQTQLSHQVCHFDTHILEVQHAF